MSTRIDDGLRCPASSKETLKIGLMKYPLPRIFSYSLIPAFFSKMLLSARIVVEREPVPSVIPVKFEIVILWDLSLVNLRIAAYWGDLGNTSWLLMKHRFPLIRMFSGIFRLEECDLSFLIFLFIAWFRWDSPERKFPIWTVNASSNLAISWSNTFWVSLIFCFAMSYMVLKMSPGVSQQSRIRALFSVKVELVPKN